MKRNFKNIIQFIIPSTNKRFIEVIFLFGIVLLLSLLKFGKIKHENSLEKTVKSGDMTISYRDSSLFSNSDFPPIYYPNFPKQKPDVPPIEIVGKIIEPQILDDVPIKEIVSAAVDSKNKKLVEGNNDNSGNIQTLKPFQIYEVVPKKPDNNIRGVVSLRLRIDKYGRVTDYKILKNTIQSEDCLKSIITAAFESKWQPAIFNGEKIDYWVEKTYRFD
jgi:Gram-negative bacterial TonB protein C-terminal